MDSLMHVRTVIGQTDAGMDSYWIAYAGMDSYWIDAAGMDRYCID